MFNTEEKAKYKNVGRRGIDCPERTNYSKRGCHTIKERCLYCGHNKKLICQGIKKCSKCKRE